MDGIFAGMFDFDGDGDLSAFEQAAELMFLDDLEEERERDSSWNDPFDDIESSEW